MPIRELWSRSCLLFNYLIEYSDWLLLTDTCAVIGCLLIDLMMLIDTYLMIVRLHRTLPEVFSRCFFLSLLSLMKENLWDLGIFVGQKFVYLNVVCQSRLKSKGLYIPVSPSNWQPCQPIKIFTFLFTNLDYTHVLQPEK